ncbi:Zinc finger matrin-type protein 3 [Orchesella cincta]|uniref:Zinc finger matrin-type protein 3 n=1 Tax=Orchesella cincta TaxID=48709 RepID=A0A1D2NB84_ORCCI|nr:Zinc finger matrin-type protein 3 [Orchesella cincta]
MANTAGGRYHANPQQPPQSQYSSYVPGGGGGQYYPQQTQQQHQQMGYQYYGNQSQPAHQLHQQQAMGYRPQAPPPPHLLLVKRQGHPHLHPSAGRPFVPPLLPPPLPPMFPWMSPALAKSMTSSPFGKSFEKEASNLPFVPIIVNDADLLKMTENVAKEAEEVNNLSLQYYKEVMKLNLPKALKDQFQPLFCKLCILSLSSPVVAKDHYNGKRHKKAVDAWMARNPLPPMFSNYPKKTTEPPAAPTGLINGFIAKHYPKTNDSAPSSKPLIPPLMQSNVKKEPLTLPPNIERKRPAPPPPPTPPQINIQNLEQKVNNTLKPLVPPPNPSLQTVQSNNDSRGRGNGPPFNIQNNPGSWQKKGNNESGNETDFPQAKKPRRNDSPIRTTTPYTQGLCQICNVQLSSQVMADQHFKGKNHAAKLAALEEQGGSGTGAAGVLRVDLNSGGNSSQAIQRPPGGPSGNPTNNKPFNRGPQNSAFQRGGGNNGRGGGGGAPPHFNQNRGNNNSNRGMNKNNRFNNKRGGKWS